MDTEGEEGTQETIFTVDDLMTGPPSPLVSPELAPQILDGIELCSLHLSKLFDCRHKNDIEPFCQDEILIYHRCSQNRTLSSCEWGRRRGRFSPALDIEWSVTGHEK